MFYVAATNFTSTGSDCNTACKYFEAAPAGWGNGITVQSGETTGSSTVDPILKWCSNTTSLRNANTKTAIGDGRSNTTTSTIFSPFRARFPSILFYVVLSLGPIFCECERDSVLFLPAAGAGKLFPKIKTKIFPFSLSPDFDSFSV